MTELIEAEQIQQRILWVRGQRVLLDHDLAMLYQVATKNLNKAVRRNLDRFPSDFMFQLTSDEKENLRFQFGTSSWGGRRHFPYVFTEQGVAMLSSVLNSKRAALVNVAIMRAFVRMRKIMVYHQDLAKKLDQLEKRMTRHDKGSRRQSRQIREVFEAIHSLIEGTSSNSEAPIDVQVKVSR